MKTFLDKFAFDPKNAGAIGVERERFFVRGNQPVPMAEEFFAQVRLPWLTYELSACQLEDHVFWPFTPWWHEGNSGLAQSLESNDRIIAELGRRMNFGTCQCAVASADMPLDVYPLPRYLELVKKWIDRFLPQLVGSRAHTFT